MIDLEQVYLNRMWNWNKTLTARERIRKAAIAKRLREAQEASARYEAMKLALAS